MGKMTVEEWASHNRGEDNWMLRNFVVGLMHLMEASIHRFNYILGIDESDPVNEKCIEDFSSTGSGTDDAKNTETIVKKNNWNSYAHPRVERGSKAWQSLAKIHSYDVKLFKFILDLFHNQSRLFSRRRNQDSHSDEDLLSYYNSSSVS